MSKIPSACLTIAGSDPSGGAGIQADLKTFTALGVYGSAVITCLTAQNSKGVSSYQTLSGDFIQQQIELVLEDLPISHIKIGMVGSRDASTAISRALSNFKGQIIYDPVMNASDGHDLLDKGALPEIIEQILSIATVITPNLPELQKLTGSLSISQNTAVQEAVQLIKNKPNLEALVLTGGHFPADSNQITDYLIQQNNPSHIPDIIKRSHQYINTSNTHGTGCTFSSALTAFHLRCGNLKDAFFQSVDFMDQILCKSSPYRGGLQHQLMSPPNKR